MVSRGYSLIENKVGMDESWKKKKKRTFELHFDQARWVWPIFLYGCVQCNDTVSNRKKQNTKIIRHSKQHAWDVSILCCKVSMLSIWYNLMTHSPISKRLLLFLQALLDVSLGCAIAFFCLYQEFKFMA